MTPEMTEQLDPVAAEARAEQITRWERGDRVLIERLLSGQSLPDEALLDLMYAEVLLREEFGEQPTSEEYERRFPRLAVPIRRQMDLHAALGSLQTLDGDTLATPRRNEERSRPDIIGSYDILREIGRGGMGIVYEGRHRLLDCRRAAIKVIRPGSGSDEQDRRRFATEAQAVAHLQHPNIVPIYELGTYHQDGEERQFVALEYVEGDSLARAIDGTPLSPRAAAALLLPLAEAMAHAHSRGIVHRDLKPANVLLSGEWRVASGEQEEPSSLATRHSPLATPRITDFGLAKRLDTDSGQTRTGAILGTPSYMAPEQAAGRGEEIGPACDIYALGAILYEMLTGRPPFKADTVLNTLHQVANLDPVPPRTLNPAVPRDLETISLKCLQKEKGKRYATGADLAADLRRYLQGEPIQARPAGPCERALKWVRRRPAVAALAAVSVAAVFGVMALWAFFTFRLQDEKRNALVLRDKALHQEALAKQQTDEAIKQSQRAAHILALAASSVDEIAVQMRAAKSEELESRNTGTVLFKMACSYARTSAGLAGDDGLILEDRQRLAEQYARSAVRLLRCAEQVGFFDPAKLRNREELGKNPDLTCLRERDDFKQFVASIR